VTLLGGVALPQLDHRQQSVSARAQIRSQSVGINFLDRQPFDDQ
jgi:hypothetical protein